ncbi:hypothetical protein LSTR_LSTR015669, partial [Laodelphax striatellus]
MLCDNENISVFGNDILRYSSQQHEKLHCKNSVLNPEQKIHVMRTTEIRCQEKVERRPKVVTSSWRTRRPPSPKRAKSPVNTSLSAEEIEEKLKAAEERRMSLEANKMATLAAKLSKIEEASKKKDEQTNVFINQTKEALDQKMETHIEKREAYITDLKSKLKDHLEGVEKTRQSLEQQTQEIEVAVKEKMKSAAAQRDENMKKMVERLKEH